MILQLHPPIPVKTIMGDGLAHVLIDYGPEYDVYWIVLLDNGESWKLPNDDIKAQLNAPLGRPIC